MIKSIGICAIMVLSHFAFAQTTALSQEQIAKVLVTINEGEIDAAKLAEKKAQKSDTKEFAKSMIDEHKKNEAETKKLFSRMKIAMADSDLSKSLKEDAKKTNKELKDTDKANFDKAYMDSQVAMHEKALNTLNQTLIPNAKNPDLIDHLKKTQAAVEEHLQHARAMDAAPTSHQ